MLDVLTWKWSTPGYRSTFGPNEPNVMLNMLERNLKVPFRFTCVTDNPHGINSAIRIVDIKMLPSYKYMKVRNPSSPANPSCYVRLAIYHPDAAEIFGERIVSLDLDTVIVDDVTPLFDRPEEFAVWGGQSVQPRAAFLYNWFNGSFQYVRAGTRARVWTDFDPKLSPILANRAGCKGSDQGWIAYKLGRREKTLTMDDGLVSYRNHVLPNHGILPKGSRLVAFHGRFDPWHAEVQRQHSWVREHYR